MRSAPVFVEEVVPLDSQPIGTVSTPTEGDWGGRPGLTARVVCTDVGTDGTLDITIEHADDPAGAWTVVDTFTTITGATAGVTRTISAATKPYVRVTSVTAVDAVEFSVELAPNGPIMITG